MLILDSAGVPPEQRADAFTAALEQAGMPSWVEHFVAPEDIGARMWLWPYGRMDLIRAEVSSFRLVRMPRHLRAGGPPLVALGVQAAGRGRFSQLGRDQLVGRGDLVLVDLTAPLEWSWIGDGAAWAVLVPYEQLGLPIDAVRRAAVRLEHSPLHGLVRDHVQRVAAHAEDWFDDAGAASLGTATTELIRALIGSAAADARLGPTVPAESLVLQIKAYVGVHLTEPGLTPEHLARAHNVSVRRLYQACAEAGLSLEQWVIDQRLEAARAELVSAAGQRRSIAATARACGFADPSHFGRRFRNAFGMTPREWRHGASRPPAAPVTPAETSGPSHAHLDTTVAHGQA